MTTIQDLPSATMINPDDEFVISQGGISKAVEFANMVAALSGLLSGSTQYTFIGDGTLTPYTLVSAPASYGSLDIYISGILQDRSSYSTVANVVTPLSPWPLGSRVTICLATYLTSITQTQTVVTTTVATLATAAPTVLVSTALSGTHALDFVINAQDLVTGGQQTSSVRAVYGPSDYSFSESDTVFTLSRLTAFDISVTGGYFNLITDAVAANATKYTVTTTAYAL